MEAPAGLDEAAALPHQGAGLHMSADLMTPAQHQAAAGNGLSSAWTWLPTNRYRGADVGRPTASNHRSHDAPPASEPSRARNVSAPQPATDPFRMSA